MLQSYSGEPVVAYALDMWNGSAAQVNSYINGTGITYPMLMNAGDAGIGGSYSVSWDVSFVIDGDGDIVYRRNGFNSTGASAAIDAALSELTSDVNDQIPGSSFKLSAPYPNPFNPNTTIAWSIDEGVSDASVKVEIHDIRGRRVANLFEGRLSGGRDHQVMWNGRDTAGQSVSSGSYLAVVEVNGIQKARFLTLVK